jgi:sugar lactone lactonase YvrE
MLAAWGLIQGLRGRGLQYYALSGAGSALGLYGYFAGRAIVLSLLVYLPFALWERRGHIRGVLLGYAVLLAVCVALFAPQLVTIVSEWNRFSSAASTAAITSLTLPSGGAQGLPDLLVPQAAKTVRAFWLMDGGVARDSRYFPVGRPLFDPLTGVLLVLGSLVGLLSLRRTALWWCLVAVPLLLTQVLGAGAPDLARAAGAAPALYLFVGLGFDAIAPKPGTVRRALQLAVLALVPVAAVYNLLGYAEWMARPETAVARRPAVDVGDFAAWQDLQVREVLAGGSGLTIGQWEEMQRKQAQASKPALPAASAPGRQQPASPPGRAGAPLTEVARLGVTVGGDGTFGEVRGVAAGADGGLFVVDAAKRQVVRLSAEGKRLAAWGREGSGDGEFLSPWDIAVDGAGRVYVLDSEAPSLQRFGPDGSFQDRLLAQAGMYHPRGIAVDSTGNIYVADTGRDRVLKVSEAGDLVATFAGDGGALKLDQPTDVAVDAAGDVYVAVPSDQRLYRLDPAGRYVSDWPIPLADTLDGPHLAVSGNWLLATDPGQKRVTVYSLDGALLGAWGGAGDAHLDLPFGLWADEGGQAWVGDARAGQVLELRLAR